MAMEWWRCKHGAPFDPKWRVVAADANVRPGDVWAVFTVLCDRASQASDRGSIAGFDADEIAAALGYDPEEVKRICNAMKRRNVFHETRLANWDKHQPKRERNDTSTERVKAFRERQKLANNASATSSNTTKRHVTPRIDKRREEKKEEVSEAREQVRDALTPQSPPSMPALKTKRGTRWPSDAVVPDHWVIDGAKARARAGLAAIDLNPEAVKFANYWSAKSGGGAAKLDWKKTWINWALTSKEGSAHGKTNHPLGVFGQFADDLGAPSHETEDFG